jgi:hypothetical protein
MKSQSRFRSPKIAFVSATALLFGLSCVCAGAQQFAGASPATSRATKTSAASSELVARELDAFAHAVSGITKYSATITIFDQKGSQTQNTVFDYTFSKPSKVTVHVVAGTSKGVTLDWDGGPTIVAHRGSGLIAMFSKTLSLHDPQVTTLQGASIDQLSFGAILSHAQQEVSRLSLSPDGTIDGVAANALTLIPSASADAGLTREVVEMSAATHLPIRVLGYDGPALVSSVGFSNIKLTGNE